MAGRAAQVTAPVLLIAGQRDRLFPYQDAERLARELGDRAELLLIPDGNHGCANVSYRHRPYAADWLERALLAQGGEPPKGRTP